MRMHEPDLRILTPWPRRTQSVILVLHGGEVSSRRPTRSMQLAYRRMVLLARAVHRAATHSGTAVWVLRNRVRGWNEPALDAVTDARWALEIARRTHPGAGIQLLGHSMGARVALRLAGEQAVDSVCALAPWTEAEDPVRQLLDRRVLIVHGDRDRVTPPETSLTYAQRAQREGVQLARRVVPGSGHAMLRHSRKWTEHVRDFVVAQERSVR